MSKKIIIRKKLTSFSGTEKNFKKKDKLKIEKSGLVNLSRTFLSSLIIVSIFFIAPLAINLTKEKMILSKDYENNSKNNLKKLLENKTIKLDEKLNKKFLYEDVLTFDEQPSDVILLSAATIEELFKSTNYNLKDVRKIS